MITPNWNPNRTHLRRFALLWLLVFGALGLYRAWHGGALAEAVPPGWHGPWTAPIVLWVIAGLSIIGILSPSAVRPVYVTWMALAFSIGWTIRLLLLGVTYFGPITACAAVFRMIGRNEVPRGFDKTARTYWLDRRPATDLTRYFKQY